MYSIYDTGIFAGVHLGNDREPELTKIFHWLTEQAEAGDAKAMTNLGVMYALGLGIFFDTNQSFHWFREAAKQEEPAGIYNTGRAYEYAEGVTFNPDVALVYYEQAAKLGFVPAMLAQARWLADPRQFNSTPKMVFEAYKAPAALNDPEGLYQLGLCYKNALGTTRNTRKGVLLLTQAAEMNHLGAQATLREYYCHKPADRVWKPKPATDREMAIIWNFVLCSLHGAYDGLAQYLLLLAEQLCLAYPKADLEIGARKHCNDIFRTIHAYQEQQCIQFIESRRWAEASGIAELYPDHIKQRQQASHDA